MGYVRDVVVGVVRVIRVAVRHLKLIFEIEF